MMSEAITQNIEESAFLIMEEEGSRLFQEAVNDISIDKDVFQNLSNLRIAVSAIKPKQLQCVASRLNLAVIFDCLNSSDSEQIKVAAIVLKALLDVIEPATIIYQYRVHMMRALKHPEPIVKEIILLGLLRVSEDMKLSECVWKELELMLLVVEYVGHENTQISSYSKKILINTRNTDYGIKTIYSNPVLETLIEISNTSDVNRFRVYEIAVNISSYSIVGLRASVKSGILWSLLEELKKEDDILVVEASIEFLTQLALTSHGFDYLNSQGIILMLLDQIRQDSDPLKSLILPSLIKFFGVIAKERPDEMLSAFPFVLDTIISWTKEDSNPFMCVSLETIGLIATTVKGKQELQKHERLMMVIMPKLYQVVRLRPTEDKVRALATLCELLKLDVKDTDSESVALIRDWFDKMAPPQQAMCHFRDMLKLPFQDIKLVTTLVLEALAVHEWGQQYMKNTPGLIELLMDRSNNTIRSENVAFGIIKTLAGSPTTCSVFGQETYETFKAYVKKGINFLQPVQVALESVD